MAYVDEDQAATFYGSGLDDDTLALVIRVAGRTVASLSNAPDPVTEDFTEAASDAELLVGRYIVRTDYATLKSKGSVAGTTASKTYAELEAVKSLAASALGEYYSGSSGSGGATGYVGSLPLARG